MISAFNSRRILAAVVGMAAAVFSSASPAQEYPSRPVKIVVPFQPGGSDVLVRIIAAELANRWKEGVVVENKPGADSIIGADFVARSNPDGYTLLATVDTTMVINRFLFKKLPYDPDRSFVPVSLMAQVDALIVAHPSLTASNVRELVDLAKSKPRTISFGSYSKGSQTDLMFAEINHRESVDLMRVPYKGLAPTLAAAVSGEIQLATTGYSLGAPMVKAGRLKILGIAGKSRSPFFPDVATTAEQGFPYALSQTWYGLFAPAGTPEAIVNKISKDISEILNDKEFVQKNLIDRGYLPFGSTPQELRQRIRVDVQQTSDRVKTAGILPE